MVARGAFCPRKPLISPNKACCSCASTVGRNWASSSHKGFMETLDDIVEPCRVATSWATKASAEPQSRRLWMEDREHVDASAPYLPYRTMTTRRSRESLEHLEEESCRCSGPMVSSSRTKYTIGPTVNMQGLI